MLCSSAWHSIKLNFVKVSNIFGVAVTLQNEERENFPMHAFPQYPRQDSPSRWSYHPVCGKVQSWEEEGCILHLLVLFYKKLSHSNLGFN